MQATNERLTAAFRFLKVILRTPRTFLLTAFAPWRIANYLIQPKGQPITGARQLYIATFFKVLGDSAEEHVWVSVLLYVTIVATGLYTLIMLHGLLKSLGSAQGLKKTLVAAAYPYSLAFLIIAVLSHLKIGMGYNMLTFVNPDEVPLWQKIVDLVLNIWVGSITVVILSKVHSVRWYKTIACFFFLGPFLLGWGRFVYYVFMDVLP
jgi:hypothetical protein